ncbi:MAG: hypothetical protein ABSE73_18110 [Planctomycetota bacterium]
MEKEEILERVSQEVSVFLTSLRCADGMKVEQFEQLCSVLKQADAAFKSSEVVPKRLAYYLIELSCQMWLCADPYRGEERTVIDKAIVALDELVLNILAFDDAGESSEGLQRSQTPAGGTRSVKEAR